MGLDDLPEPLTSTAGTSTLDDAYRRLVALGLIGAGTPSFRVVSTRDLVRSTVGLVEITVSDGPAVRVYHKRIKPREGSRKPEILARELRETLSVSFDMEQRLVEVLPHPEVQIGRTLAFDIESLEQVTLAVPGEALGAVWRLGAGPSRRQQAKRAMHLVGRTCRIMEDASRYDGPLPERLTGDRVVERRVSRLEGTLTGPELTRVADAISGLETLTSSMDNPVVRSHGDLNATNVLLHDDGISLIDFSWQPRLRLTDLTHFAFRLEYATWSPRRFAADLVRSLIDGYGDADVSSTPAWRFLRYSKLIRLIGDARSSRSPLARARGNRALRELMDGLGIRPANSR